MELGKRHQKRIDSQLELAAAAYLRTDDLKSAKDQWKSEKQKELKEKFGEKGAAVTIPEPGIPDLFPIDDHLKHRKELAARVYGESYAVDLHLGAKHSVIQAGALFHLSYPTDPKLADAAAANS
jgi:hypothetical protein